MCDYTQVTYSCGHIRYLVLGWCVRYQRTHERCAPNVIKMENNEGERCGTFSPAALIWVTSFDFLTQFRKLQVRRERPLRWECEVQRPIMIHGTISFLGPCWSERDHRSSKFGKIFAPGYSWCTGAVLIILAIALITLTVAYDTECRSWACLASEYLPANRCEGRAEGPIGR